MPEYHFNIFADYFQIYLEDERFDGAQMDLHEEDYENLFAVGDRMMMLGTARNMVVPVTVAICEDAPSDDFENWDHVNEGSIEIPSGCLLIRGCTDASDTAPHISLTPGCYRVRIYYGDLDKLSDDGLEGDDHYKIVLWPAAYQEAQILKRKINPQLDSTLLQ